MRHIGVITVIVGILIYAVCPGVSQAQDLKQWRVGISGEASFVGGGTTGTIYSDLGSWSPENREMFSTGRGFGLEVGRRIDEDWETVFGTGYTVYPGDSSSIQDSADNSISLELDDLTTVPIYIGFRSLFTSEPDEGLVPYVGGEVGAEWLSEVEGNVQSSYFAKNYPTTWWNEAFIFMWGIGGGLEYRTSNIGFFTDIRSRWVLSPNEAGDIYIESIRVDKKGSGWQTINAHLGLSYYF